MVSEKSNVATVEVPMNIALIKYWGKKDEDLIIPLNDSVSLTVDTLFARTTVELVREGSNSVTINGKSIDLATNPRYERVFTEALRMARKRRHEESENDDLVGHIGTVFKVTSTTNFPICAGLASSAAGFAAIAHAIQRILQLGDRESNRLARLGSGSACRSMFDGLVRWRSGVSNDGSDCYAERIGDPWPSLRCLIFVFDDGAKQVGSTPGMRRTKKTSELLKYRTEKVVPERIERLTEAFSSHDFGTLARIIMQDSNQFHAVCLDSFPPLMYLSPSSFSLIRLVDEFNVSQIRAAYTFDAGPNACVILQEKDVGDFVCHVAHHIRMPQEDISTISETISREIPNSTSGNVIATKVILSRVGGGPRYLSNSL